MDNFRDSYFNVTWDLTQKHLRGTFWGKQYDTGRGFAVTVINGGQVVEPTTEVIRLKWEKPDNTAGYVNATVVNGKFIIENIDQMFTVHGSVRADFELSVAGEFVASITFYVNVEKAVAVDAIESSSDFTALQDALADVGDMQAQVDAVIANATVDSEVILARDGNATLKERLDSDKEDFIQHQLDYMEQTALKVDMDISTNLLNINGHIKDKTIDLATGEIINSLGGKSTTVFIQVYPNTIYTIYRISTVAYYDINKNYISYRAGDTEGGASTFSTPENAYYIRFAVSTGYLSTAQFNIGAVKLAYEPYYATLKNEQLPINGITVDDLTNLCKKIVINKGDIYFDFANKIIRFVNVGIFYGKTDIEITQNLDITTLMPTYRYILYYDIATGLLGVSNTLSIVIPDTSIIIGMFWPWNNMVFGIDEYYIDGVFYAKSKIDKATLNESTYTESAKRYPIHAKNLSPLASRGIVSGTPVNFDFDNNKISITNARIVFGNRSQTLLNLELNITDYTDSAHYILFYNLVSNTLNAITQSSPNQYLSLDETSIIICTFNIRQQYVEGLTNYTINGKPYKIMSTDDVGKGDYALLDTNITQVFDKNVTIPSQATEIANSTVETIYALYDALMAQYPTYITKTLLGNEPTGLPIYRYDFIPVRPTSVQSEKRAKLILLSGTHPEKTSVWSLYNTLTNICNNWQDDSILETIRFNVDLIVVPIVNPYSYNSGSRTNSNGVDINRNFPKDWEYLIDSNFGDVTYKGVSPLSEIESQIINNLMIEERNNVLGLIDFHNFNIPTDNYYFICGFPGNVLTSNILKSLIQRMDRKWKKEYTFVNQNVDTFMGVVENIIAGALVTQASALGIKGAITYEVCNKVYADANSISHDSNNMTMAYESFVNFLAMFLNELIRHQ